MRHVVRTELPVIISSSEERACQDMLSLLSSKLHGSPTLRGEKKPLPASALAGDALLEALVAEVHNLAADIIAVTSSLNVPIAQSSPMSLMAVRNFLPRSDARTTLLPAARKEADILLRAADSLSRLLEATELSAKATEALLAVAEARGLSTRAAVLHEAAARQWRGAAALALDMVDMLEPEARWRLAGAYTENSLILCRGLRLVAAGKTPAIDERAGVARPPLPQHRRAPRYALSVTCRVWFGGQAVRAQTHDISVGGIGLARIPMLKLRDQVEVEFDNGRRLPAIVVWSRENRIGLQFDAPLPLNDPLLSRKQ